MEPRELWLSEARDFTPWLAQNLDLLGKALGLDLELVRMEARVGAFACDIQAQEAGSGRRVIIENQLGETDHSHLGQLLTYAAGLDAAVVVWIAPSIREEHREAIDFLNRHTREGIDLPPQCPSGNNARHLKCLRLALTGGILEKDANVDT